jgi:hypothetical protein
MRQLCGIPMRPLLAKCKVRALGVTLYPAAKLVSKQQHMATAPERQLFENAIPANALECSYLYGPGGTWHARPPCRGCGADLMVWCNYCKVAEVI